jgi:hypothetical protein
MKAHTGKPNAQFGNLRTTNESDDALGFPMQSSGGVSLARVAEARASF